MTRRNPPAADAARRERLAFDRRSAWQREFGPPTAETLARMRADLYARRGYSEIAPDWVIADARRRGRWARDEDLREAGDARIAWLWREHRCDATEGPAPLSSEVVARMLGCDMAHLRTVMRSVREGAPPPGPAPESDVESGLPPYGDDGKL